MSNLFLNGIKRDLSGFLTRSLRRLDTEICQWHEMTMTTSRLKFPWVREIGRRGRDKVVAQCACWWKWGPWSRFWNDFPNFPLGELFLIQHQRVNNEIHEEVETKIHQWEKDNHKEGNWKKRQVWHFRSDLKICSSSQKWRLLFHQWTHLKKFSLLKFKLVLPIFHWKIII